MDFVQRVFEDEQLCLLDCCQMVFEEQELALLDLLQVAVGNGWNLEERKRFYSIRKCCR